MDPNFFHLRKHIVIALCASALLIGAIALQNRIASTAHLLIQLGVLILFIQFVWSGAFAIAALLAGNRSYFFSLLLLCVSQLAAMSAAIVMYTSA